METFVNSKSIHNYHVCFDLYGLRPWLVQGLAIMLSCNRTMVNGVRPESDKVSKSEYTHACETRLRGLVPNSEQTYAESRTNSFAWLVLSLLSQFRASISSELTSEGSCIEDE